MNKKLIQSFSDVNAYDFVQISNEDPVEQESGNSSQPIKEKKRKKTRDPHRSVKTHIHKNKRGKALFFKSNDSISVEENPFFDKTSKTDL